MKDEEMAHKYAICRTYPKFETNHIANFVLHEVEGAFLAGLKAQPKWHILAEEHDVLPKEGQKVKVLTEEGKIEESTYFYDTYYEEFAFSNIGFLKVFAWCELSTFNKE